MFDSAGLAERWSRFASSEEIVLDDPFILEKLSQSEETRGKVRRQLRRVQNALGRLPERVAVRYRPWCLDEAFYRFGGEAFNQSLILYWVGNALKYRPDLADLDHIFVARQIIRPSALNSTPRIKFDADVSFLVYPAPGIAWLYELMGALSVEMDSSVPIEAKLEEYLLYILAYRAYEASASWRSAYAIDHLIDEIVQRGNAPVLGHLVSDASAALAGSVENFIVNHEIAHALLNHAPGRTDASVMESEADALAIELMLLETVADVEFVVGAAVTARVPDLPIVGHICLNLWGMFRETAEWRAASFLANTPAQKDKIRARISQLAQIRIDRVNAVGHLSRIEANSYARSLIDAGARLNYRLANLHVNFDRASDIVRLARSLAECDYEVLRQEILGSRN